MRFARTSALAFSSLFLAATSFPRQAATSVQRDPQALALAQRGVQALLGNVTLTDVTLQGTANYTAGSDDETGSFKLDLKGTQESKLVLNLTGGTRQETRQLQAGGWVGSDGQSHAFALHNCWTDASTLFPIFSLIATLSDSQIAAAYLGQAIINGASVDHLQLSRVVPGQNPKMTTQIQELSAMDIYLEAASHLPLAVAFTTHPDDDLQRSFPVQIQFSGYQQLGGIHVPMHIQKLLQGTLTLDMVVTSIATNTGISDINFSTQ